MFHHRIAVAASFCTAFLLHTLAFAQVESFSPSNKIQRSPDAVPLLRIQNDIVAVQVSTANDTVSGEVRYAGLFNIGTASDLPLLNRFPAPPFSSHVNIRVDGQVYSNDPLRTGARLLTLLTTPYLSDSTLICDYQAGPIRVRQRLTPKKFSRTTGAILIEYELENPDPNNAHQVGVLLELDMYVVTNDQASILTSFDYNRYERKFGVPALPDFFQAFQGSLVKPDTVAQGTLVGIDAVRPDSLVIGQWSNLSRVQWYYAVPNNAQYDDSAVLLKWNEKTLLPNEVRRVATYYGKGDATTQAGALTLHLTALRNLQPLNGQLSPNPFDVNLLVFNFSGTTATAVQATLQLPVGLALVSGEPATKLVAPSTLIDQFSGTASWKVVAQCPLTDIDLNMAVEVSATPNLSNAVSRLIFLPSCTASLPNFKITAQPDSTVITAGETASFQINMTALNGFNQSAQLSYWPPTVGITGTFSRATIPPNGAAGFDLQTNRNLLEGEYPFLIIATGSGLTRSDSVKMRVRAAAPLDNAAPVLLNPFPSNGATNVPRDTKISVEVYDPAPSAGLDLNRMRMSVNGAAVAFDRTSKGAGYVLTHAPATPFRLNESVSVDVYASDLAANRDSLAFAFTTVRDVTPPFFTNHNPAVFARNVPLRTDVIAEVFDELAGVDSASIIMTVADRAVTPSLTRIPQGFRLRHHPDNPFADSAQINVVISASDLAVPPNAPSFSRYHFITVRDSLAPLALELFPAANATNIATNFEITARLRDDLTGVDSAAVRAFINGKAVAPQLKREGRDFLLTARPASTAQLNDTIHVKLVYSDLASRPNRDSLAYAFFIVADKQPPIIYDLRPARFASNVPLTTPITFQVRDEIAGVDSASIKLKVNGKEVARVLRGNAAAYEVSFTPDPAVIGTRDTVDVEIIAADLSTPPNDLFEQYYYTLSRDRIAPFAAGHNPQPNSRNVSLESDIALEIRDASPGVDSASIKMFVNGGNVPLQFEARANGYLVRHVPGVRWRDNQTVRVKVEAQDLAAPPNVLPADEDSEYSFTTVWDSLAPAARDFSPRPEEANVSPATEIRFVVEDDLTGVDSSSVRLFVNGERKAAAIAGEPRSYQVSYKPASGFPMGQRVEVGVEASDRATTPNAMPRRTFHFTIVEALPDLIVAELAAQGEFQLGRATKVKALIRNEGAPVRENFRIEFKADAAMIKDTTIAANAFGAALQWEASVRFESGGTHIVNVFADADDRIKELSEANNSRDLAVQIVETLANKLTVRPNPFTPNGDGINDVVEFDFSGLALANPALHIFDVNGIAIYLTDRPSGKRFTWDGRDERGREVQPGVYLYTLRDRGANVKSGYLVVAR